MRSNDSMELMGLKKKQAYMLLFNIAVMASSFVISLVALPIEVFFVVAIIILFALHDIEKDFSKASLKRFMWSPFQK